MGCGCLSENTVASPLSPAQVAAIVQMQRIEDPNCIYTFEVLNEYKDLLNCVKANNTVDLFNITMTKLNSYLGVVQSAINYTTNSCYFVAQLDEIQILIQDIKDSNQC